ncbi:MAG: glutaminyl-tRNA synthase (glutamine-hydrolyzing) subunit A [Candidatus Fraserbacteria bacterium RBG_16_55_9]|uniref:Glutamyl-tRNA(Gln) amidotransferase subunit A n=1 Tax=Fraserbacteria sp. (strain RBG_16_55_9) TaxID=1817864 RepID=A0A1F5UQ53_FRAXR|nr:MAG: glutaminyl-tRNA synthase (glutamine-hydrolyzing) subunit A [Candidatus Fraserbacteria bacterium RBG_16_55_9]
MNLNEKTLHQLIDLLGRKEIQVQEILEDLYRALKEKEPSLQAYLEVNDPESLLKEAQRMHDRPLRGLPISVKDLISTVGFRTTCGSKFLEGFHPIFDATAIAKLKAAGATILGKTNLDEFGMGSSNENSGFHTTKNPVDLERVPGGSSGGSAAAVAAHTALAALGTDTGGSVRLPAAFCGIVGLKPTYGLVSRYGLAAYASSLDQIGPLTKDVRDAALVLSMMAGHDLADSTSVDNGGVDYTRDLEAGIRGFRVGIVREFVDLLKGEARQRVDDWKDVFKELGAQLTEVSLPHAEYAIPTYYLISASEASANLARYDGVRYSVRKSDETVEAMFSESRVRGFGPEVKRRVMLGTYALSAGYYDAWYGKAQRVRGLIKRDFDSAFQKTDVLITPASPTPAFQLGEKTEDPLAMYLSDVYLVPMSLAGICAISIPGGKVNGLPFGLQIIGNKLQEAKILRAAYAFEQAKR